MMTGKGEQKQSEKNLSHCHSIHHKSTATDTGLNLALHRDKPTTNYLSYSMAKYALNWYLESWQYVNQNTEICSVERNTYQTKHLYVLSFHELRPT
jgi:hypothetical protein